MISKNVRPDWLSLELYPFEDKWIEIGDNTIHYVDEGEGDVILFSHAAVGWSFVFRNLIKILSKSYRCIAIDFPGFGLSAAGPDYVFSISSQGDIVNRFVKALDLKDLYLVGHDTGGPSAFSAFTERPANVKGFIICDAIIFPVAEYKKISLLLWIVSTSLFKFINRQFNILINSTLKGGFINRKLSAEERDGYLKVSDTWEKRNRIAIVLSSLRKEESFMEFLKSSFETTFNDKPTLLIYGDKDPVHEMGISFRIEKMLRDVQLKLIDGEMHFPFEGAYEQISALVDQWIKSKQSVKNLSNSNTSSL
jgi:haloalkane dehalogenase